MKDNKKSAGSKIAGFFKWIGNDIKEIGVTFKDGDWKTRLSFVIMGFGPLMRKLYARGIAFLALEILFFYYLFSFGLGYLVKFGTLGTQESGWSDTGLRVYGDNSFLILLYGLLTIIIIVGFIFSGSYGNEISNPLDFKNFTALSIFVFNGSFKGYFV